jgi:hypothetical protein
MKLRELITSVQFLDNVKFLEEVTDGDCGFKTIGEFDTGDTVYEEDITDYISDDLLNREVYGVFSNVDGEEDTIGIILDK